MEGAGSSRGKTRLESASGASLAGSSNDGDSERGKKRSRSKDLDLGHPSAPKERWQTWKAKEFPPQTSERTLPETREILIPAKGTARGWEPYTYDPKAIVLRGSRNKMARTIQGILSRVPYSKNIHEKTLLASLDRISKREDNFSDWVSAAVLDLHNQGSSSPYFKQVCDELQIIGD